MPPKPETKADVAARAGHTVHIHASKRVLFVLGGLILVPWLVVGGYYAIKKSGGIKNVLPTVALQRSAERVWQSSIGPWGDIQFIRIAIEPPEEFIFASEKQSSPDWFLGGYSLESYKGFLAQLNLTPGQRAELEQRAELQAAPAGVRVRPSDDLVLSLAAPARERLYNLLALFPENRPQSTAFSFNPTFLDERIELSGLTDATIGLFRRLLYHNGDLLLFADMNLVLPRLPDDRERVRFVKTLSRKITVLGKLRVTADTDIEKIAQYWGFDGRAKDLRPLLESLRRVPGGANLDLAHLLPAFARRRLYTYPVPSADPLASRRDCHWSALNFFAEMPDDRFTEQAVAVQTIGANYYQVATGARLGDLVLLLTHDEKVIHSAAFVADDVVFTKNGAMFTQPWMLQRIPDLVDYYSAFYPANHPLRVRIYREKELAPVQRLPAP